MSETPQSPRCAICGLPATCIGAYEGSSIDEPACDTCCGHGNEDGHCRPLVPPQLLAAHDMLLDPRTIILSPEGIEAIRAVLAELAESERIRADQAIKRGIAEAERDACHKAGERIMRVVQPRQNELVAEAVERVVAERDTLRAQRDHLQRAVIGSEYECISLRTNVENLRENYHLEMTRASQARAEVENLLHRMTSEEAATEIERLRVEKGELALVLEQQDRTLIREHEQREKAEEALREVRAWIGPMLADSPDSLTRLCNRIDAALRDTAPAEHSCGKQPGACEAYCDPEPPREEK